MTKKELKKYTSSVGAKLWDVAEDLDELKWQIDMGPDLNKKEADKLDILFHVKQLVEIARDLYPYAIAEE